LFASEKAREMDDDCLFPDGIGAVMFFYKPFFEVGIVKRHIF
jgi:hypothetical protein